MNNQINLSSTSLDASYSVSKTAVEGQSAVDDKQADKDVQSSLAQQVSEKLAAEISDATKEEQEEATEVVTTFMENAMKDVAFSNKNEAGKLVIQIFDKETNELIKQFPADKIISMAEKIKDLHKEIESISGLIFDSHV
tara:strand:+ start:287 stop:703 length:417 start_codon:yes stop_codon:yes gene_type:complete